LGDRKKTTFVDLIGDLFALRAQCGRGRPPGITPLAKPLPA
jgi:hypothetical protein